MLGESSTDDTACRASREHCHQGGPDKTKLNLCYFKANFTRLLKQLKCSGYSWGAVTSNTENRLPMYLSLQGTGALAHLPGGPLHPPELITWDRGQEGEEQRCCVSLHTDDTPVTCDAHHHPLKQSASVATAPSRDSTGNQKHSQPVTSLLTCTMQSGPDASFLCTKQEWTFLLVIIP